MWIINFNTTNWLVIIYIIIRDIVTVKYDDYIM